MIRSAKMTRSTIVPDLVQTLEQVIAIKCNVQVPVLQGIMERTAPVSVRVARLDV